MSTIGSRIAEARNKLNWSQKELGERVGTTQQLIQKIESGNTAHSRYLEPIAIQLNVSYNWVIKGVAGPSSSYNSEEYMISAAEALSDALNSFKIINMQQGNDLTNYDFGLLEKAFDISLRGKLTGDYITAALRMSEVKPK